MSNFKELTYDDMKNKEIGAVVRIPCRYCEGLEEHEKQQNGKWMCLNCWEEEIEFK